MTTVKSTPPSTLLLGLLCTIAMALGGWSLKSQVDMQREVVRDRGEMKTELAILAGAVKVNSRALEQIAEILTDVRARENALTERVNAHLAQTATHEDESRKSDRIKRIIEERFNVHELATAQRDDERLETIREEVRAVRARLETLGSRVDALEREKGRNG